MKTLQTGKLLTKKFCPKNLVHSQRVRDALPILTEESHSPISQMILHFRNTERVLATYSARYKHLRYMSSSRIKLLRVAFFEMIHA